MSDFLFHPENFAKGHAGKIPTVYQRSSVRPRKWKDLCVEPVKGKAGSVLSSKESDNSLRKSDYIRSNRPMLYQTLSLGVISHICIRLFWMEKKVGVVTSITSLLCYFQCTSLDFCAKFFTVLLRAMDCTQLVMGRKRVFQAECYQSGLVDRPTIKREQAW